MQRYPKFTGLELIAADTLNGTLPNTQKLLAEILDGLRALHEAGVVHLDLKPENVMLSQVNNEVKIIDLGFAFESSYFNTAGATQKFAAPEAQRGEIDEIDARSDLYSAGKIMEYICSKCNVSPSLHTYLQQNHKNSEIVAQQ